MGWQMYALGANKLSWDDTKSKTMEGKHGSSLQVGRSASATNTLRTEEQHTARKCAPALRMKRERSAATSGSWLQSSIFDKASLVLNSSQRDTPLHDKVPARALG